MVILIMMTLEQILEIDQNAHILEFVSVIEKSTIYAMTQKNARGKIACLKTSSRHELMQDKTSGTCTTGSAPSKTSKRDLGNVTKKTCATNCTR